MDVKSVFLNSYLDEKVFVEQPKEFEDPKFSNHVYKLSTALYNLKQALRAWYEKLTKYLLKHGYQRGGVDKTLFIHCCNNNILIAQIYVNDKVFGAALE